MIIQPIVTEKATREWEKSKYTFVVKNEASKIDIQKEVQNLYGVKVISVNIRPTVKKIRVVGKGKEMTKRQRVKKATVTLEKGKTMDIYKFK